MKTYEQIIAEITDKIKTNGNKEITGVILQGVLLGIIAAVQANQQGKLEYYHEDVENGTAQIAGEILSSLRAILPEGMYVDTSNFKFLFEDSGLEIVDNANERHLIFDGQGLSTNMPMSTEGTVEALGGLVLIDGYDNKYIVTVNQNRELIVEPYDE